VARGQVAQLTGRHFSASSRVSLILSNRVVGVAHTDASGTFRRRLVLPSWTTKGKLLTATDPVGRQATVSGLVNK
jgi:hypothetical protein